MIIENLDWLGGWTDVEVEQAAYGDGSLAVRLITNAEGYPDVLAVASVNLSAYGLDAAEGAFWVGNYSEHAGLGAALEAVGAVVPTGRAAEFGPFGTTATEYRLAG
jgi:hypothetical protein